MVNGHFWIQFKSLAGAPAQREFILSVWAFNIRFVVLFIEK